MTFFGTVLCFDACTFSSSECNKDEYTVMAKSIRTPPKIVYFFNTNIFQISELILTVTTVAEMISTINLLQYIHNLIFGVASLAG